MPGSTRIRWPCSRISVCVVASSPRRQRLQRTYAEITPTRLVRAHQSHAGKLVQHRLADRFLVRHGGFFELHHQHVALNLVSRRPCVIGSVAGRWQTPSSGQGLWSSVQLNEASRPARVVRFGCISFSGTADDRLHAITPVGQAIPRPCSAPTTPVFGRSARSNDAWPSPCPSVSEV